MIRRFAALGTAALALLLGPIACSDGSAPAPNDPRDPCWSAPSEDSLLGDAELGSGEDEEQPFLPLSPEEEVGIVMGPQGGYHIMVRPRLSGLVPGDDGTIDTLFSAFFDGTEVDPFECAHHLLYGADPSNGNYILAEPLPLLIVNERVADVIGQELVLRMEAVDLEGRYARVEHTVIPRFAGASDAGPLDGGHAADGGQKDVSVLHVAPE